MNLTQKTPAEAAAFVMNLTGGKADLNAVANSYRQQAATMRGYAAKAAASKSGVYRGYTEAQALEHAAEGDRRAESVPAELRKLMA